MKTTQDNSDKILRDKINSLDSLPEGYTPSLDSKWDLLMAGMQQPAEAKIVAIEEKKEKKRFFYLYAAAACFLAVFTFGWLFLKDDKITGSQVAVVAEKTVMSSASTPEETIAADQQNQAGNEVSEPVASQKVSAPATAKKASVTGKNQQTFITKNQQNKASQMVKGGTEIKTENPTQPELLTSAHPEQLLAITATVRPAKNKTGNKKKAKSVEVDFAPENVITPSQHDPQVAQQNLKFKFLPRNEGGNVAQQENPLKIKHTF